MTLNIRMQCTPRSSQSLLLDRLYITSCYSGLAVVTTSLSSTVSDTTFEVP